MIFHKKVWWHTFEVLLSILWIENKPFNITSVNVWLWVINIIDNLLYSIWNRILIIIYMDTRNIVIIANSNHIFNWYTNTVEPDMKYYKSVLIFQWVISFPILLQYKLIHGYRFSDLTCLIILYLIPSSILQRLIPSSIAKSSTAFLAACDLS